MLESTAKLHEGEAFARRLQCAGITFQVRRRALRAAGAPVSVLRTRPSQLRRVQVIFTLVCSAAALVVWKVDGRDGRFSLKFHVPLFSWLLVAAVICPLLALCKFAVDLFMMLLEMASLTLFENVHYVLMGLSRSLRCAPPVASRTCAESLHLRSMARSILPHRMTKVAPASP